MEILMLTASELRELANIIDNDTLPEGTEHNPNLKIRHHQFITPSGKVTLELALLHKAETP